MPIKIKFPVFHAKTNMEYKALLDALYDIGFTRGGFTKDQNWRGLMGIALSDYFVYTNVSNQIVFQLVNGNPKFSTSPNLTLMNSPEHFIWYVKKFKGQIGR